MKMCQLLDDKPAGTTSLLSLDAEVLDLVLCQLSATETARVAVTCRQLSHSTCRGSHAARRWRKHCTDLLGPAVAGHLDSACEADEGSQWHCLYASSRHLDVVHWSAVKLGQVAAYQPSCRVQKTAAGQLARFGHTATAAGELLVLLGGVTRDGLASTLDVSVLDTVSHRLIVPELFGQQPPALRHLCTSLISIQRDSPLHSKVLAAVHEQQQQTVAGHGIIDVILQGHTLVTFGGLSPDDALLGGRQLHILWLAADASWGVWLKVDTTGHAPEPRAYACCQAFHNNSQLVVFGGWANGSIEGTIGADIAVVDGFLLLCVYLFDVNNLAWTRKPTLPLDEPPRPGHVMIGPSTCPGPRKQAMSCTRVSPVTGHEELLVMGGCGSDGLASCVPYALDLETFRWMKGPVMGYLPIARDAGALMQVSHEWALLIGGKGPQGAPLSNIQRLHLPTLSWRPPPLIYHSSDSNGGRPPGRDSVDFTATAGVVVGGCREGPYGHVIVPRVELLLPGPPVACRSKQQSAPIAVAGGYFQRQQHQQGSAASMYPTDPAADDGCCCGSCCSCMARKAAAARGACGDLGPVGSCISQACPPGSDHSWAAAFAAHQRQRQQQQQALSPGNSSGHGYPEADLRSDTRDNSQGRHARCGGLDRSASTGLSTLPPAVGSGLWFNSGTGCGKQVPGGKLSHHGCWQNEIEPAADQPASQQQCYTATRHGLQCLGSGMTNPGSSAETGMISPEQQQQWQAPGQSVLGGMALVQVLAAVVMLLMGLLLVYPSISLQEAAGRQHQPDSHGQL